MFSKIILSTISLFFLLNIGLNSAAAANDKKAISTMLPPLASQQEKQDYLQLQKSQSANISAFSIQAAHIRVPIEFTDPDLSVASARSFLISDFDGDGYYQEFSNQVDVDTALLSQDVYIEFFIRYPGGSWQYLHSSGEFTIDGNSVLDTVEIATSLMEGYIPDLYDIRIDVHDAIDPRYGVSYGPADFPGLAQLPLEDEVEDSDIYLGSTGVITLLILLSLMVWRLRQGDEKKLVTVS